MKFGELWWLYIGLFMVMKTGDPAVYDSEKATTHLVTAVLTSHNHLQAIYCLVVFEENFTNREILQTFCRKDWEFNQYPCCCANLKRIEVKMPTYMGDSTWFHFQVKAKLNDGFTLSAYDSHLTCVKQLLSSTHTHNIHTHWPTEKYVSMQYNDRHCRATLFIGCQRKQTN